MQNNILDIENVTVSFDGFKALNRLNFSMEAGELRVIIGPNGAGKTTFLDVITGKVQPTEGKVTFQGKNMKGIPEYRIACMGIGRKFQTPRVYLNLSVRENLDLVANRSKNVFSTLFSRPKSSEHRRVVGLLETIGLEAKANLPATLLSHGEKQRLEIGMLVAQSPDLLLVDEPVAGLTDEETENVGSLLLALAESHSIIVIEHDMEFVRQIARKVTVLHQGSVLCEGSMDEIQNDPKVIEVYLGHSTSITPHQLKLLRIVAAIAWSDGELSLDEKELIVSRLSSVFSDDITEQDKLRQELGDYLLQDVDIDNIIGEIQTPQERELVLKLAYEVIEINARNANEPRINEEEASAYNRLVQLLQIPSETIQRLENEAEAGVRTMI